MSNDKIVSSRACDVEPTIPAVKDIHIFSLTMDQVRHVKPEDGLWSRICAANFDVIQTIVRSVSDTRPADFDGDGVDGENGVDAAATTSITSDNEPIRVCMQMTIVSKGGICCEHILNMIFYTTSSEWPVDLSKIPDYLTKKKEPEFHPNYIFWRTWYLLRNKDGMIAAMLDFLNDSRLEILDHPHPGDYPEIRFLLRIQQPQ